VTIGFFHLDDPDAVRLSVLRFLRQTFASHLLCSAFLAAPDPLYCSFSLLSKYVL